MAKRFTPFEPFNITDTELNTWFERDRAHVELRNRNTDKTIVEWWDEAVSEAQEDGFLPRICMRGCDHDRCSLHREVYEYARERGFLSEKALAA